ncbi:MAG: WD40 repeat domain-containing protein [Okeania sp. SIO3B5]|uniref:nSTAND1 domain-containing NTPase n=1 Tax=Okeania sp. SIO3B5 TaxID=2607811 RepID=UPI001401920F|nr:WD40 repeat domain-containing protein [Okeania sp. SIO3B5]NEO55095.1 WD40 repeat domain-containing protein [Okeania sp. SIO3B5]
MTVEQKDNPLHNQNQTAGNIDIYGNENDINFVNIVIYNYSYEKQTIITSTQEDADDNLVCPYQDLYHFNPENSKYFFGRKVFVEKLYQYTETRNFIPVLGASGSGKSSVILAGLVPRLVKAGHWQFTHFRPGNDPFLALAQALVPLYEPNLDKTDGMAAARKLSGYFQDNTIPLSDVFATIQHNHPQNRTLLIADQFEELYTLCSDESTRRKFLDLLLNTFQSLTEQSSVSTVLVATMRADFFDNALSYRPLVDLLQKNNIMLGPMNSEELKEVIEEPAKNLEVNFEGGLVERILNDVDKQPGNLPLLEFALTKLWEKRQGKKLTHKAYKDIGEVSGALTLYADDEFKKLKPEEQQKVRRIFVQLVRPGQGTEDTRRVATKADLNESNWDLVRKLADARLVVTSRAVITSGTENNSEQETVEVVHEALIKNWGQLREWMEVDREFLSWQEQLRLVKMQWGENNKDKGSLLRGAALAKAEEKLQERPEDLEAETEFIQESIQERDRLKQEEEERQQRELEAAQRLVKVTQAKERQQKQANKKLRLGAIVLGLLGIVAVFGWRRAVVSNSNITTKNDFEHLKASFNSTQTWDTLIEGIKQGKKLKNAGWAEAQTRLLGADTLRQIISWQGKMEYNRLNHDEEAISVVFSPKGDLIATAGGDGITKLSKPDGTLVANLEHGRGVYRAVFSPKGDLVATASQDNTAKIWNSSDGSLVKTLNHDREVNRVVFSPKGDLVATASKDNTAKIWKSDGTFVKTLTGHTEEVRSIAFSPKGDLIATGSFDNTAKLWKSDGSLIATLKEHNGNIYDIEFSSEGDLIATAGGDGKVKLWKPDGSLVKTLEGHNNQLVLDLAFSPKGDQIASAGYDNTVKIWNTDGTLSTTLKHSDRVYSVVYSNDGEQIASASDDNTVKIWQADGTLVDTLEGHKEKIYSIAFSPKENLIATASADETVRLWNILPYQHTFGKSQLDNYHCRRVAVSPNNLIALGCYYENTLQLRKLDGTIIQPNITHNDWVTDVAFSPNGELIATITHNGKAQLWKPDGTKVLELPDQELRDRNSYNITFSPKGDLIVAGLNRKIKIWKADGSFITEIDTKHGHEVTDVAISPKGDLIATASLDGDAKLWTFDGKLVNTFKEHRGSIYSIAFSPKGDLIATASRDNTVKLWKPNGTVKHSLIGHTGSVLGIAFSSKGDLIATASNDKTVRVWKPDGTPLLTLSGHEQKVESLAFNPNRNQIISISDDKTIRLWNLDLDDLLARSCNWVDNYLKSRPEDYPNKHLCDDVKPSAQLFLEKGNRIVTSNGNVDGAAAQYREALKLDPNLKFDPLTEAKMIAAPGVRDEGGILARKGKIKEAIDAYNVAQKYHPKLQILGKHWDILCRYGSLYGHANDVLFACDNAVNLEPKNPQFRDSRGLARGLTNNFQGAVADFEVFIQQVENSEQKVQRSLWVESLQKEENPFTLEVLEKLR